MSKFVFLASGILILLLVFSGTFSLDDVSPKPSASYNVADEHINNISNTSANISVVVNVSNLSTSSSTTGNPLISSPIPTTSAKTTSTLKPHVNPTNVTNVTSTAVPADPVLPDKTAAEDEHNSSMAIFFVLCVLALGILLIHFLLHTGFQYVPESIIIVVLGAVVGMTLNALSDKNVSNWRKEEAFSPTAFFLVLLPPIIFESGYNLHKGNFFQNIGSILVFAIFGTAISAFVTGFGIYFLGLADVVYKLGFVESCAFGSLISAVDPVATIAIFHALNVDPVLNMLVFGESILNDAIAIVLTTAILESDNPTMSSGEAILQGITRFCLMFFASAGIGVLFALVSALLLKHVDLRKNPSLEFGMMLVFTYAPYVLAEGIHLSGIMAILFCGIVMSHYTHFNLSTVTQITMQQTLRTLAFIAETCVFAYLGLALFSFKHRVEPALVIWSIILCLIGRACNIFPLAFLVNKFREHQITKKMMFIMWFSGLRGAISYALSLHLNFSDETRHVIITTTLIIVLFTTVIFGGSTMPLLKCMQATKNTTRRTRRRKRDRAVIISKTQEWGQAIDSEHMSETTEPEAEVSFVSSRIKGFAKYDVKYFIPFFTRRFTQQMSWSNEHTSSLIDQYEKYPCLYVVKHKDYHNKHLRSLALQKIVEALKSTRPQVNEQEVLKKFLGLRTTYSNERKKVLNSLRSGMSEDEVYKPALWYYNRMAFLNEHLSFRASKSSLEVPIAEEHGTQLELDIDADVELKDCKSQMTDLTNKWYQAIRISPDHSDEEQIVNNTSRTNSISSIVR